MSRLEIRLARQKRIRSFKGILSTVILTTSLLSGAVLVETTSATTPNEPVLSLVYECRGLPADGWGVTRLSTTLPDGTATEGTRNISLRAGESVSITLKVNAACGNYGEFQSSLIDSLGAQPLGLENKIELEASQPFCSELGLQQVSSATKLNLMCFLSTSDTAKSGQFLVRLKEDIPQGESLKLSLFSYEKYIDRGQHYIRGASAMEYLTFTTNPAPTTTPGYIKIGCVLEYDQDEGSLAGKFAAYKSFTYFKKDSPGGSYVSWDKTFSVNPLPANSITYLEIDQASCAPGTSWGAGTKKVTDFRLDPQYGVQITNGDGTAITPQDIDAPQWNLNNDRTLTPFKVLRGLQNGVLKTSFILTWAAETYDYNIFNIWPIYTETSANTANQPLDFLSLRSVGSALYFNVAYEPPAAPTNLTISANSATSASVSWQASESGSPSGYKVLTYDSNGNLVAGKTCQTYSSTGLTCVVYNLVAGSTYTFKVVALKGDTIESVPSAPSSAFTLSGGGSGPSTPQAVTATAGVNSAIVSWQASTGSPTSYTVTSTPGNRTCTVAAPATSCTVEGLTAGTSYIFTVTASNGTVTSQGSTPSEPVTPTSGGSSGGGIRPPTQTNPTPAINLPSNGGSTGGVGTASTEPGQVFTLTGSGMNNVNTVNVGSQKAVITLKTATKLGFKIPKNLPAGLHDLSLYGSFGSMTEAKFFSIAKKKIKTRALGFAGNSPALSAAQKSEMRIFLNRLPGKVTLVCNGSTSSPTVTAFDRKLARDRATKACDYARELNPSLQTEIRITPAAGVGYKYRSVKLTLKNY